MAGIQSTTGLASGLDIQGTVNQLMAIASLPKARLEAATKQLQSEQVSLTSLTALVVGVQLATDRLGQTSLYTATTASSSNAQVLKATTSGSPKAGSYSFIPVRQATAQQLTSSLFASKDQTVGSGEVVIRRGGFLDDSVVLDQLNGGAGVNRGFIRITDRTGASKEVDLRFASTINDVIEKINTTEGLNVVSSVSGDRLKLTDTSSGSGTLSVTEVSGGTTAKDLGLAGISTTSSSATGVSVQSLTNRTALSSLLDGRGLVLPASGAALKFVLRDGSQVEFTTALSSNTASLGDLLQGINAAGTGKVQASISTDGKSLEFKDLTTGAGQFTISSPSGSLANQLGVNVTSSGDSIQSGPLIAGLSDTLLSSLNGGKGLGTLGKITITDRQNNSAIVDLESATTLGGVIERINQSGIGVRAQLNRNRTGIEIVDTTGSTANNLVVANFSDSKNTATNLKIAASVSSSSIDSGALNRQWINENTQLKDWNQGSGVNLGTIKVTDSAGKQANLNLTTLNPKTIGDVIRGINNLNVDVEARINETGDGILLVDTAAGSGSLVVADSGSNTTAKDLGILGTATDLTVNGSTVKGIDGTRTVKIATTTASTVTTLAESINDKAKNINATILSLGNTGVRLVVNSSTTGRTGRLSIESNLNLGFSETVKAEDALLAYGATGRSGGALVTSSTNQFKDVVPGVSLELLNDSEDPITVTVRENSDSLAKQLKTVVDQYNKIRDKLKTDASYDEATKSVGVLFGSSSVIRVDLAFGKLFTGQINGAGSIKSITQLGVRINEQGKLEFDESKLNAALEKDAESVKEFFTKENTGFSARAKVLADSLAGTKSGALIARTQSLQSKIDQNNRRVDDFAVRLDKQRNRLLTQFYNMELAISKNQENLKKISSIQIISPNSGS